MQIPHQDMIELKQQTHRNSRSGYGIEKFQELMWTRIAVCGGVPHDASGNFLFSFCHRIGSCDILWAELRGILDGLELLWNKGFRKVVIECDSEAALELVVSGIAENHPCSSLVHQIRSLINRNWDLDLVHPFGEANKAADHMAKMSHILSEGLHVFCYPHEDLSSILVADLYGPLVHRLCVC
ncbi:putative ribonuclease H protein At1g65750 family [Senna tora]|uniref:Putative ribonuclease H protein At1g65750 family n=1 Tax=Senna tora TaxID=362788 RepID=A0A834W7V9_9FABA|nr:putative ribonuclease H protein At1g65750 family [Senna tora]